MTPYGRLATAWSIDPVNGRMTIDVSIPDQIAAVLRHPGAEPRELPAGNHTMYADLQELLPGVHAVTEELP
jgi:hypothetical protein